jgi:hypothetical protein
VLALAAATAAAPLAAQSTHPDRAPARRWALVGGIGIDAGFMGGKLLQRLAVAPIDLTLGVGGFGVAAQVCLRLPAGPALSPRADARARSVAFLGLGLLQYTRRDRRYGFIEVGEQFGVGSRAHIYGEVGVGLATRVSGIGGVETVPTLRYQVGFQF